MKTEQFQTLDQAQLAVMGTENGYYHVIHDMDVGEQVERHYHPNTTETIILPESEVAVYYHPNEHRVSTPHGSYTAVTIESDVVHGLTALTDVIYHVFRDNLAAETIPVTDNTAAPSQ